MDIGQALYLAAVVVYFLALMLFVRMLLCGQWAERTYWRKRPKLSVSLLQELTGGQELPRISILVPAYNETEVINNTIEHLARLYYPPERLEIIVVTDAKEQRAKVGLTTQEVVEQKLSLLKGQAGLPSLRHLVVPEDFDGQLNGACLGRTVPSTKGRALNYALPYRNRQTEICAFYDAESRPDKDVLLYVACRYLKSSGKFRLWQGPVYQIRNFFQLYPINKVAALYQSVSHEWNLPVLLRQLPFAGGTNLFVTSDLLDEIGGFDHRTLTEDLELGIRAFVETGAWPEYIPYPSTEQTPATYRAFFRQRLRWGSGYLQVMDKLQQTDVRIPIKEKRANKMLRVMLWKGPVEWLFFQTMILFPPLTFMLILFGWVQPQLLFAELGLLINITVLVYFLFTFDRLYHFLPFINFALAPEERWRRILALSHLLLIPVAGFFFIAPFTTSLILKALHRQPVTWVKTPRTNEAPIR
ncbi:MAG: glycosyltransferase [Syntrophomonadaceae bacterium]|nr:glycosyltransferase [Syntrophomonadaceae bacterium]